MSADAGPTASGPTDAGPTDAGPTDDWHADDWHRDVLDGFERLTLPLGRDEEGEVVATLVRPSGTGAAATADVLYVHGWSDYFFQAELADFWERLGARFHALDLRKYGRSLRPGQSPGYVTDLRTYFHDVEAALAVMGHGIVAGEQGHADRPLVLVGHSTGGLLLSLWAAAFPGRATALVLNSPWLEFQAGGLGRAAVAPAVGLHSRWQPRGRASVLPDFYARSISARLEGEWTYDVAWRPDRAFPVHAAWLDAVFHAHREVARGLGLTLPVLVLLSDRSTLLPVWSPEMLRSDAVIDVDRVARAALDLGEHVTVARVRGALHDVVLSAPDVRAHAYAVLERWAATYALR